MRRAILACNLADLPLVCLRGWIGNCTWQQQLFAAYDLWPGLIRDWIRPGAAKSASIPGVLICSIDFPDPIFFVSFELWHCFSKLWPVLRPFQCYGDYFGLFLPI